VLVTLNREVADRHSEIETIGLLVHEATHACQHIRECIGEKEPSSEFEAYSMQAITQGLLAAMRKTWPPKRRRRTPCVR
jgi:hypothetical protein